MTAEIMEPRNVREGELLPANDVEKLKGPIYTPAIDIHETAEGLVLEADLPGVVPEALSVEVEENVLRIVGRTTPYVPEDARAVYEEYQPGNYVRWFIIGDEVDRGRISARLSDGVLQLVLPKAEKARPRRIDVRTE